jgi:hypothetical protein
MPRDEELGKDLAKRLSAKYTGYIDEVVWTYDSFLELDQLDSGKSYCKISPNNYLNFREGRGVWREDITLMLTLVSKVGPTNGSWVGAWLDSWDKVVRGLRDEKLFDRHKPTTVEVDERYDPNMYHNNHRLLVQASLFYLNVEVI